MKKLLFFFFLFHLLLSSFFLNIAITPNPISRVLPVFSYFNNGSITIDKYEHWAQDKSFINGHYYSDKAPFSSLVIYPVAKLFTSLGIVQASEDSSFWQFLMVLGDILCGSLPFALLLVLALKALTREKTEHLSPVILVTLAGYGSYLFAYAGIYFSHMLSGLLLLCAYILVKKKKHLFWAGLLIGIGFSGEYPIMLAYPVWAVQLFMKNRNFKNITLLTLGLLPGIIFVTSYNWYLTGSFFELPYKYESDEMFSQMKTAYGFGLPSIEAIWNLLFTQFKGLLFYIPVLLLSGYILLKQLYQKNLTFKDIMTNNYLTPLVISTILLISSYYVWWGGWCYGPRHLVAIGTLLLYETIRYLSKHEFSKIIFWTLTLFGLFGNLMAKLTVEFMIPEKYTRPLFQYIIPKFQSENFNNTNILSLLTGSDPVASLIAWIILFSAGTFFFTKYFKHIKTLAHKEDEPLINQ